MPENLKVYVGIPCEGWIHKSIGEILICILEDKKGYDLGFEFRQAKPIDGNRNGLVKNALNGGYDYLLMCDYDNPPTRNPLDLVELDKDVIILPTPIWKCDEYYKYRGANPIVWNVFDKIPGEDMWKGHIPDEIGLEEVDAGGTGCVLIARRVLEKVRPAFIREWDEDGIQTISSDILFCRRAKDAGFEIWAHFGYPCHHFKPTDLIQVNNTLEWRDIRHARQENKNTAAYWDEEWRNREERQIPPYDTILECLRLIEPRNGAAVRVLDFGCGRGDLLQRIRDEVPTVSAAGIDFSEEAVRICRERGLEATVGEVPEGRWDVIVSTEVLEHLDDDIAMLRRFFEHSDHVIYSVPNNCLPPGLEREHRRVYTAGQCREITPYCRHVIPVSDGDYLVVTAQRV